MAYATLLLGVLTLIVILPVQIHGKDIQFYLQKYILGKEKRGVCEETLVSNSGEFTSPNYTSNYPSNQDCYYYITVTGGLYVKLVFTSFDTENSADYVTVYDGSSDLERELGSYSGSTAPAVVISTTPSITVHFHSDDLLERPGFHAIFKAVNTLNDGGCGGTFYADYGIFTSPGFPSNYQSNQDCYYFITVTDDAKFVRLEFTSFSTESNLDYVTVIDGTSKDNTEIASYSGAELPLAVPISSVSSMIVHFHSDGAIEHRGFTATFAITAFDEGCGGNFSNDWGILTTPNYPYEYSDNQECYYYITLPSEDHKIQIQFVAFDTEDCCDLLYIYDGACSSFTETSWTYSGSSLPLARTSTGSSMCLKFTSDGSITNTGFDAFYTSVPADGVASFIMCDNNITTNLGGIIYSHSQYPGNYPSPVTCSMKIDALFHYNMIYLNFLDMDIYNTDIHNCSAGDKVILTPSSEELVVTLCDKWSNETEINITSSSIDIMFGSELYMHKPPRRGFKVIYALYYEVDSSENCLYRDDFKCSNNRCIAKSVFIDGYDFCGDGSSYVYVDQDDSKGLNEGEIAAIVVCLMIIVAICLAVIVYCCCISEKRAPRHETDAASDRSIDLSRNSGLGNVVHLRTDYFNDNGAYVVPDDYNPDLPDDVFVADESPGQDPPPDYDDVVGGGQ